MEKERCWGNHHQSEKNLIDREINDDDDDDDSNFLRIIQRIYSRVDYTGMSHVGYWASKAPVQMIVEMQRGSGGIEKNEKRGRASFGGY